MKHLTDLSDPVVHIHLGASQTQGGFAAHGDDMFALSTILASIFKISTLFRIATAEHLLHESIIVDAIIARVISFKPIPVIMEYLFEDAPSRYTFMIHNNKS
jgi:hypothetical protein